MWVSARSFVSAEALPVEEPGENGRWEDAPGGTAGSTEADETGASVPVQTAPKVGDGRFFLLPERVKKKQTKLEF